jgi:hypothetical protein
VIRSDKASLLVAFHNTYPLLLHKRNSYKYCATAGYCGMLFAAALGSVEALTSYFYDMHGSNSTLCTADMAMAAHSVASSVTRAAE